ncbi:MAG: hypothetical protein Q4F24_10435 [Eubacteriales bacterium]|nr:hypothetical protein [Eubacteriales bacterium]
MAKKIGKIVLVVLVIAVLGLDLMMFLFMKQAGFWFDGLKEQVQNGQQ